MNVRGLINQVTAGRGTAGRPMGGGVGGPAGGMGGPAGGMGGRPAGGGAESTGARIGGMVGRFLNSRRGGRRL